MSVSFTQESDSCASDDLGQTLEVGVDDAGAGPFLWIKTDRWAVDNVAELVVLLEHVRAFAEVKVPIARSIPVGGETGQGGERPASRSSNALADTA